MSRSTSIEVLNDADDMERRLNWILFKAEIAIDYSVDGWVPGDPLFEHPRKRRERIIEAFDTGRISVDDYTAVNDLQYVRPMIQSLPGDDETSFEWLINFGSDNRKCMECEVLWTRGATYRPAWLPEDENCWCCGKHLYNNALELEERAERYSYKNMYSLANPGGLSGLRPRPIPRARSFGVDYAEVTPNGNVVATYSFDGASFRMPIMRDLTTEMIRARASIGRIGDRMHTFVQRYAALDASFMQGMWGALSIMDEAEDVSTVTPYIPPPNPFRVPKPEIKLVERVWQEWFETPRGVRTRVGIPGVRSFLKPYIARPKINVYEPVDWSAWRPSNHYLLGVADRRRELGADRIRRQSYGRN